VASARTDSATERQPSPETRGPGATPDFAIDTYAAICNVHTYNVLRLERSYTPAQIETWWSRTLSQLLLA